MQVHSYRNDDSCPVNHLWKNEQAKSYQTNPKDTNANVQITQDGAALLRCSKFIETPKTRRVLWLKRDTSPPEAKFRTEKIWNEIYGRVKSRMFQQTETRRLICISGSENLFEKKFKVDSFKRIKNSTVHKTQKRGRFKGMEHDSRLHDERERFKEFKASSELKYSAKSKGCKAFKKFVRAGHSKDQPTDSFAKRRNFRV